MEKQHIHVIDVDLAMPAQGQNFGGGGSSNPFGALSGANQLRTHRYGTLFIRCLHWSRWRKQALFKLEAATNCAGRISTFELSMNWLYVCL